jgi:hypothetical protein
VSLELRNVIVADDGGQEGRLVFQNGQLIAVLTKLSPAHDDLAGRWYVEAAFGELTNFLLPQHAFDDLPAVCSWLEESCGIAKSPSA